MTVHQAVLVPGDGISLEVSAATNAAQPPRIAGNRPTLGGPR